MHIFREGGNIKLDNNDFILKIVAELEQKGIKTGFDKLKRELEKDPAKIDVILDTSGTVGKTKGSIKKLAAELHNELSVEISKLQKQGQDINFDLSVGDVEEVIQNVINHTKELGESFDVASDKAQKFLAKFNKKSGGVLINSDEFKAVQEAINGLGNTHTIEDLNKAMNTLEVTYDNMSSKLRNSGKSLNPFINAKNEMSTMDKTIEGISLEFDKLSSKPDDVANAIKELSVQQDMVNSFTIGTMEWADAYGHLQQMIVNVTKDINNLQKAQSSKSLQPRIDEIQLSMEGKNTKSKNYDYQIDTEIKKLKDLGFTDEEVAQKVKILTDAQLELKRVMDSNDFDSVASKNKSIIESDKERTIALNQVRTAYGQLKNDTSQYYNLSKQTKLSTDIQNWLSKNSRASKEAKESLNAYYRELSGGRVSVDRLNYIEQELKSIDATQRGLGKLGKNLKDQFKEAGTSFTQWLSVSSGIMALVYQLQKIPKEVIAVNKAMIELTKVSDASDSDITKYFDEAADSAKRYGSAVSDMINATADWSRLGYNLPDSKKLAEIATLYTNVGDGIEMNTANEHLISTLQGFQLDAEDAIGIIDRFNEVANNFPIDTAGIGEALQRSAASFYAANTDLSKSIALITGTNSVVQDPDSVGTMWKTVSMRLRGVTQELEAAGLETEGMVKSTAQLRDLIQGLTGFDIMTDEAGTQFKDIYDIVVGIGHEWKNLTDVEQAGLLEVLAGKRQGNALSAALNNISMIEEAYKTAENSAGSALEEQEKYEQGIEYSLKRLEAVFQTFANHILDSNVVKGIFDFGSSAIETIDKITSKLGSLETIGLGVGLFAGVKNSGVRKCVLFICFFCFEYALFSQEMTISRVEMRGFSQPTRVLK